MSMKKETQELRRRISQSMKETGPYDPTNNCKKLQKKLAKKIQVQQKRGKRSRRK